MKAINQEGQKIIDESLRVRRNNKLLIIDKIRSAITFIKLKDIDSADNDIFSANDLTDAPLPRFVDYPRSRRPGALSWAVLSYFAKYSFSKANGVL